MKTVALVFGAALLANVFGEKVTDALNIDPSGMTDEIVAAGVAAGIFLVGRRLLS